MIATALAACSACRAPEQSRYEIETTALNGPVVHLCDTWTGEVWQYSRHEERWKLLTPLDRSGNK